MSDDVKPESEGAWKWWCCAPVIGLVVLFAGITGLSFLTHEEEELKPSSEMAMYHCREMVKEQLKDPSSAEFSNENITGHGDYTVTGTVRATNSFGGPAAHDYTCTANFDESDGGYFVNVQVG